MGNIQENQTISQSLKIIILGDYGVGKTSIINNLSNTNTKISNSPIQLIGYKDSIVKLKSKNINVQLWDTSGSEKIKELPKWYYKNSNAIILVYDIGNFSSYQNLKKWLERIYLHCDKDIPILLLANKTDINTKIVYNINNYNFNHTNLVYHETNINNPNLKSIYYDFIYSIIQ